MSRTFNHTPVQFQELDTQEKYGKRWYETPEGVLYPSITTILSTTGDKTYLEEWRKSLGEERAAAETQRCAERGTSLHLIAEHYLNIKPVYMEGAHPTARKMFNQCRYLINKIYDIVGQEIPLYSDLLKAAGRCDVIASYDGVPSIIDFKSSNNIKRADMIEDYFIQCTAYSLMAEEMFGIVHEQLVIIMGVEKGMNGLCFKKQRKDYIGKLLKRIKACYEQFEQEGREEGQEG